MNIKFKNGTAKTVAVLQDMLSILHKDALFCFGSKSALIFAGTKEDYVRDIPTIEEFYHTDRPDFTPFADRRIKTVRRRDIPGEPPMFMIIVEGAEDGSVWVLSEYEDFIRRAEVENRKKLARRSA